MPLFFGAERVVAALVGSSKLNWPMLPAAAVILVAISWLLATSSAVRCRIWAARAWAWACRAARIAALPPVWRSVTDRSYVGLKPARSASATASNANSLAPFCWANP
jgi:hypothetical protein